MPTMPSSAVSPDGLGGFGEKRELARLDRRPQRPQPRDGAKAKPRQLARCERPPVRQRTPREARPAKAASTARRQSPATIAFGELLELERAMQRHAERAREASARRLRPAAGDSASAASRGSRRPLAASPAARSSRRRPARSRAASRWAGVTGPGRRPRRRSSGWPAGAAGDAGSGVRRGGAVVGRAAKRHGHARRIDDLGARPELRADCPGGAPRADRESVFAPARSRGCGVSFQLPQTTRRSRARVIAT